MEVTIEQSTHKETKEISVDQFTEVSINKAEFIIIEVIEPSYSVFTQRARGSVLPLTTVLRRRRAGILGP